MGNSLVLNRRPKVPAEDTAAFGAIAERFRRAGALEQAVSLCRDGLKKFPDHISARVTLGWSLLDIGRYDEARIELEQVLRRAPDNLAAIRGLAELHDRFEHTLNLPMDGPGQWPPPPEAVESDVDVEFNAASPSAAEDDLPLHTATAFAEAAAADEFIAASEQMPALAPAEMGLPLWTPEAPPAATAPAEHQPQSGMSSVREIDAFAGAPVVETVQPAVPAAEATELHSVAAASQAEDYALSDARIAELLAESDSLDSVAEIERAELGATLDLRAGDSEPLGTLELEADLTMDMALVEQLESSVAEPAGSIELQGPMEMGAEESAAHIEISAAEVDAIVERGAVEVETPTEMGAVETDATLQMGAVTVDVPTEMDATEADAPVELGVVQVEVEAPVESGALQAIAEEEVASFAQVSEAVTEVVNAESVPLAAAQAEEVDVVALEEVAETVVDRQAGQNVVPFEPVPAATMAAEPETLPLQGEQVEDAEPVAAVIEMVDRRAARNQATIAALEGMLSRVQARRRQLMAQSVA